MSVDRCLWILAQECSSIFWDFLNLKKTELFFFLFRMDIPWWWSGPKGSKLKTYGAQRGFLGRSSEREADEAKCSSVKCEDESGEEWSDQQCVSCGGCVAYPEGRFCWDCEQYDRVVHPRRGAQDYPDCFKYFTCGKCGRMYVGFVLCSPCEGCPYSDCLYGASVALKRLVARRTCAAENCSSSVQKLFSHSEEEIRGGECSGGNGVSERGDQASSD